MSEAHRRTNVSSFDGPRILATGQYISQSASPAHLQWLQPQPFCQRECRIGMLLERVYPLYPVLVAVFPLNWLKTSKVRSSIW